MFLQASEVTRRDYAGEREQKFNLHRDQEEVGRTSEMAAQGWVSSTARRGAPSPFRQIVTIDLPQCCIWLVGFYSSQLGLGLLNWSSPVKTTLILWKESDPFL